MMPSIRLVVIYLTLFGIEMSCLYAVTHLANQAVNNRLSPAGVLVILIISFAVFKILRRLVKRSWLTNLLGWLIAWPVVTLGAIKIQLNSLIALGDMTWLSSVPQALSRIFSSFEPVLLLIICSALLWWLGRRLAMKTPNFQSTVSEFQFGLMILVLVYLLTYGLKLETGSAVPVTLIFFTCGLAGISVSHDQIGRGWFNSLRQWHWSAMLLVSIGLILLAGLVISIIVSPDFMQLIIKGLKWVWETIMDFLMWIANLFPHSNQTGELPPPAMPQMEMQPDTEIFHFPVWLKSGLKGVWAAMMIGIVLLAIWRITSQIINWMRRKAGGGGGEYESLKGNIWRDWLNWLKRFFSAILRIRRRGKTIQKQAVNSEAATIRQIYLQWLHRMRSAGYPRHTAQTPLEFQAGVEDLFRGQEEAVDQITHEYIEVRYGAATPSIQDIERIREQWIILKKADLKRKATDKNTRE
jgi:hypothetical protein